MQKLSFQNSKLKKSENLKIITEIFLANLPWIHEPGTIPTGYWTRLRMKLDLSFRDSGNFTAISVKIFGEYGPFMV